LSYGRRSAQYICSRMPNNRQLRWRQV